MQPFELLSRVNATIPPEEIPQLATFLAWHAKVPNAYLAHPKGLWDLYQAIRVHLPDAPTTPIAEIDIEFVVLLHLLSKAQPPLAAEERQEVMLFFRQGAYRRHHLTGIVETYRRWRTQRPKGG